MSQEQNPKPAPGKKEIPPELQILIEHANQITQDGDPLTDEIKKIDEEIKRVSDEKASAERTVEAGRVEKPSKPSSNIGETSEYTFGIWAFALGAMFVIHLIMWLPRKIFDIDWDTWAWTCNIFTYGLGIAIAIVVITGIVDFCRMCSYESAKGRYDGFLALKQKHQSQIDKCGNKISALQKQKEEVLQQRYEALHYGITKIVGVPCPVEVMEGVNNYNSVKPEYLKLRTLRDEVRQEADPDKRDELARAFMDAKLQFFYLRSMKEELDYDVYKEFNQQYDKLANTANGMVSLRQYTANANNSQGENAISQLDHFNTLLDDDNIVGIRDKLKEVLNRDVSGFFSGHDTDAMAQQTMDMQELLKVAKAEYDEFAKVSQGVMYALGYARGVAYWNLYLGAELISYLSSKAAGGNLTTERDIFEMGSMALPTANIDGSTLTGDYAGAALRSVESSMKSFSSVFNKDTMKWVSKDGQKVVAGAGLIFAAGSALVGLVDEHNKKVEANAKTQDRIVKTFNQIVNNYEEGKANMVRAIEIVRAIVKCNRGFMKVYEDMRKKYLEDGDKGDYKQDAARLAQAIGEYNKVAKSKM